MHYGLSLWRRGSRRLQDRDARERESELAVELYMPHTFPIHAPYIPHIFRYFQALQKLDPITPMRLVKSVTI